jgi:hypothetical protein
MNKVELVPCERKRTRGFDCPTLLSKMIGKAAGRPSSLGLFRARFTVAAFGSRLTFLSKSTGLPAPEEIIEAMAAIAASIEVS